MEIELEAGMDARCAVGDARTKLAKGMSNALWFNVSLG